MRPEVTVGATVLPNGDSGVFGEPLRRLRRFTCRWTIFQKCPKTTPHGLKHQHMQCQTRISKLKIFDHLQGDHEHRKI